jgi:hypothetical protein
MRNDATGEIAGDNCCREKARVEIGLLIVGAIRLGIMAIKIIKVRQEIYQCGARRDLTGCFKRHPFAQWRMASVH